MGITNFPKVTGQESIEDLRNLVAILIKEVEYLSNGGIDSHNIREIAGYKVNTTDLKHRSGIVGMSGADPNNPEAVRFWSGLADPDTAPWRVNQAGKMFSTGAEIKSKEGYPRVEIDPENEEFVFYYDEETYIRLFPDILNGIPVLSFTKDGATSYVGYSPYNNDVGVYTSSSDNITFYTTGSIKLTAMNPTYVDGWYKFYSLETGRSLQQDLDALSARISALESAGP